MARPRPTIDEYNRAFWEALNEHRIRMPRCASCGHVQYPMGPICSACLGQTLEWVDLSGFGKVWGYAIYHHVFDPAFATEVPYNVSMIELEEGPLLASNVIGIELDALHTGLDVEAVFEPVEGQTLLRFRPRPVDQSLPDNL